MAEQQATAGRPANPRRKKLLIGAAIVAVVVAGVLILLGIGHQTTDNAQLDGNIVPVRASVAGYVDEVRFHDNQRVHRGDTLALIQTHDYEAFVAQALAALNTAKATLEANRSGLLTADHNAKASGFNSEAVQEGITSAETRLWKARQDSTRTAGMFRDNAATPQQVDAINAETEVARAQLQMARKQAEASRAQAGGSRMQAQAQEAQVALAEAMVAQREAELRLAQIRLGNTAITAPCDAIISKKAVEAGQYLAVGSPVCAAVDLRELWVTANFKETQLTHMRVGQPVKIKVDAYPGLKLQGHVTSFSGATGARFALLPPDNATGNFVKVTQRLPVRIDLELPADTTIHLAPGLSVLVDVDTKS